MFKSARNEFLDKRLIEMLGNRNGQLMNGVKIKKRELLDALRANLEKHKDDVLDALEMRREEMKEYFTAQLEKMSRDEQFDPKESINFRKPQDNSADYEKAIRMVEMTQDEIIELDEDQFDKLVMDNWGWKSELISTSALYGKEI